MKRRVASLSTVDVAAALAVDPLVRPHRAEAVAAAVQLHRAAAAAADVAGRVQPLDRRRRCPRTVPTAARSAGWDRAAAWLPARCRGSRPLRPARCSRAGPALRSASRPRRGDAPSRRQNIPRRCYGRRGDERPPRELPAGASGRDRPGDPDGPRPRAAPPAADPGDDRLGELRAAVGARSRRLGADQQVRRGLPRPPLLRRLRGGRRRRAAGDRSGQVAVRRRARQRPGPRRRPGQQRRLHGADRAGRHDPRPRPRPRRPPQPRDEAERLRQALQPGRLPRPPRGHAGRHGGGRAPRRGAQAGRDRRRLVGLPAPARLRRLPRDRRLGRRQALRRHGPLRRPRRRRRAPEPGALRRRRHDHDPQDPLRPAQRHDPLHRGARRKRSTKRSSPASRGGR